MGDFIGFPCRTRKVNPVGFLDFRGWGVRSGLEVERAGGSRTGALQDVPAGAFPMRKPDICFRAFTPFAGQPLSLSDPQKPRFHLRVR